MLGATMSQKRVLGDSTNARRNVVTSPSSAKKRKLNTISTTPNKLRSSQTGSYGKLGSSQPKSQFEEEVLEKITQDISGLKQKNSEKDQHWDRPSLEGFNAAKDNLCFQQIDVDEGNLFGGRFALKLFGVKEYSHLSY